MPVTEIEDIKLLIFFGRNHDLNFIYREIEVLTQIEMSNREMVLRFCNSKVGSRLKASMCESLYVRG